MRSISFFALAFVAALSLPVAFPVAGHGQLPGASAGPAATTAWNPWEDEHSGTTQPLRGIHAVGDGVAWASGAAGTVLRTEDSGYAWQSCAIPPGAEKLDFRSIWGWDAKTAIVMSSGPGAQSRIYRTTDGCAHWTLVATNKHPEGFWDALVFSNVKNGYLLGDPVKGRFFLLRTEDGGLHWRSVVSKDLSTGGQKLGVFAASNQAMVLFGPVMGNVSVPVFGTSGAAGGKSPYIYSGGIDCGMEMAHRNPEGCLTRYWDFQKTEVPMAGASNSQGIFALGVHGSTPGDMQMVAVGGDYTQPGKNTGTAAWRDATTDKWTAATKPPHGYRSSVAWDAADHAWIAVGPNGSDVSYDNGKTWSTLGNDGYNALSLPWVVGPDGHIAKVKGLKK